jgi:hypothetical protein
LVPLKLAKLADSMPYGHPWESNPREIVVRHTLVPLYLYFANSKRREDILASFLAGTSNNPAASLGLTGTANRSLSARYKFCTECVEMDEEKHGFSIAYLEHQPTFVRVCAVHHKPLLFDCARCQNSRKALNLWRMAGRCDCENPQNSPAHTRLDDSVNEASFLWIAKQVRAILSNQRAKHDVSPTKQLRDALISAGFGIRTGLNSDAIVSAMAARYGSPLLQELGISESGRSSSGSRWPSRLLGVSMIDGNRTPNFLLSLLLAGLVADEVSDSTEPITARLDTTAKFPAGYSKQRELTRPLIGPEVIELALRASQGRIAAAAWRLKVSPSRLAVDMQRQGIQLPLTSTTTKRLGADLIEAVRKALGAGIPKVEIQESIGVSSWSLQLIELDSPELRDEHRDFTVRKQRDKHRHAVEQYRILNPSAGRVKLKTDCSSAFDWLWRFDAEWLEANLPRSRRGGKKFRGPRKDWGHIDRACVNSIQSEVRKELEKEGRPKRLTASRLLGVCGALRRPAGLLPLAVAEAWRHAEDEDAYLRRRIKWALRAYSSRMTPISINQLRRVAALHPHRLLRYQPYIVELAQELGLTIDARCSLSPMRK